MNPRKYRELNKEFSPTYYLTLISIIQSLALGAFLAYSKLDYLYGQKISLLYYSESIIIFTIILFVWHEYSMSTSCLRWDFNIIDSLLPFLFGITQFFLIILRNNEQLSISWISFLCVITVLTFLAYYNQNVKAIKYDENKLVYSKLGNKLKNETYLFVGVTFLFWTGYLLLVLFGYRFDEVFLIISSIVLFYFGYFRGRIWKKIFHL
ncbi:MAG: hypothetical protein A2V66_05565 [Ignavibacteria bacterium RBG_13_36_8]|nr:MAG: hypothetical protein A2V66_05565 [Ignavibacteria bacterium RBG_13_36_8]